MSSERRTPTQCDRYCSVSHISFLLQVIRRPVAPIEFCRPRAPSGLELDPFHYLEIISCTAQFAFRLNRRSGARDASLVCAAPVVVACRLTLALFAFVGWCWGWGVGTKNFLLRLFAVNGAQGACPIVGMRRTSRRARRGSPGSGHLQAPHFLSFSVACHFCVLRAAHAN